MRLIQELPEPCRIESEWMILERKVSVDGRDVVIVQNVDLRKPFITRAEFKSASFRKLQEDSKRCLYRQGLLLEPLNGALSTSSQ
ncbi:MAG: hypothetical protein HC902_06790 [Calothrix sp. SM1_5_4]|nr:hypothetical protein [Calothrix sp. SM1_5_4]